jgi:NADPH:quinone reductase-like Zn-dependent oxidoreductase
MNSSKKKAVVFNKKGSPVKLIYCEVNKPVPNNNKVLIKVHAVAANVADYLSIWSFAVFTGDLKKIKYGSCSK